MLGCGLPQPCAGSLGNLHQKGIVSRVMGRIHEALRFTWLERHRHREREREKERERERERDFASICEGGVQGRYWPVVTELKELQPMVTRYLQTKCSPEMGTWTQVGKTIVSRLRIEVLGH